MTRLNDSVKNELAAIAGSAGCSLANVRFQGGTLQLTLDHPDGVTVEHCQTVSRQVSAYLDVAGWGDSKYTLEVTSPGLDRELFHAADFERFTGSQVRVTWHPPEGRKTVVGRLEQVVTNGDSTHGDAMIDVRVGPRESHRISLQTIDAARLVPEF